MGQRLHAGLLALLSPLLAAQQKPSSPASDRDAVTDSAIHPPCWSSSPERDAAATPTSIAARGLPTHLTVPKGTKITLRVLERVASDTTTKGASVRFVVAHDIAVQGVTVLPAGAPVDGTVTDVKQGIPYRQWPDLEIRVREVRIGGAKVRLTHSDPGRHPPPLTFKDAATCALFLPLCIASAFGVTEDGPEKPDARSGIQGEVTPCEIWYFWVKSPVTIPAAKLADTKSDTSALSGMACPRIMENPRCDYLEIK